MAQYIVNTATLHIGDLRLSKGDVITVDREGIHFSGKTETRSDVSAPVRHDMVSLLPDDYVPPVKDSVKEVLSPDSPTSDKYEVSAQEEHSIPTTFKTRADQSASPEKKPQDSQFKTVQGSRDVGDRKQIRKAAEINSFTQEDGYVIENGIRTEKPKPFKPTIKAMDGDIPLSKIAGSTPEKQAASFQWDKSRHWKTRVKEANLLKESDPTAFQQVVQMEDETVRRHIS